METVVIISIVTAALAYVVRMFLRTSKTGPEGGCGCSSCKGCEETSGLAVHGGSIRSGRR